MTKRIGPVLAMGAMLAMALPAPAFAGDLEGGCAGNGSQLVTVESMLALGHTITEERVDGNGVLDGYYCIHELPVAAWASFGGRPEGAPETLKLFSDNELPG